MKRSISLLTVLAFVLAFSGSAIAQTIDAYAEVIQDISYTKEADIQFGQFETSFSGSATLDPKGVSNSGLNGTEGNDYNAGKVFISGANGQTVTVTLSQSSLQLDPVNNTASNDYFTLNPINLSHTTGHDANSSGGNDVDNTNQVDLDNSGNATVWVGGTLNATDNGDGMDPDTYANEGNLSLTINYTF